MAPDAIYPRATLYQDLRAQGVKSYIFQHRDYTPSPISDAIFAGADVRPYPHPARSVDQPGGRLLAERERSYYFLYFEKIDTMGHATARSRRFSPPRSTAFLLLMAELFHGRLAGRLKNTLFLLSADHGQVPSYPAKRFI